MPVTSPEMSTPVAVIGAGTMGRGIAQVAAAAGHTVCLIDSAPGALEDAREYLAKIMNRLLDKGKITADVAAGIRERTRYESDIAAAGPASLVIEAIVEDLSVKRGLFKDVEANVGLKTLLASNTSSLSIASIGSALEHPERFLGLHFFNPAPLMPLVEVVPGIATAATATESARALVDRWGKTTVLAKDTPGFIVNRVARPFYGEALRILEEGLADAATIDWAMREIGGFRMGPFELMDLIGNDINYTVTQTVFEAFFYDPRFKPALTQKRLFEAGYLGRKSGRGYYEYREGVEKPRPRTDPELGEGIVARILAMLINEAADAVFMKVASVEDIDLAMTRGVNYPKGLLQWADEIGLEVVLTRLTELQAEYGEDRYRPNPLLRRMVREGRTFYGSS